MTMSKENNLFNGKVNTLSENDFIEIVTNNPFYLSCIPQEKRTKAVLSAACRKNPLAISGTKPSERNEAVNEQLAAINGEVLLCFESYELTQKVIETAIKNKPAIICNFGKTLPLSKLTKEHYLLAVDLLPVIGVREKHLRIFNLNYTEIVAGCLRREAGLCVYLTQSEFELIENYAGSPA